MQCPRCQGELPDDARFCGICGHRFGAPLSGSADAPSAAAPVPPEAVTQTHAGALAPGVMTAPGASQQIAPVRDTIEEALTRDQDVSEPPPASTPMSGSAPTAQERPVSKGQQAFEFHPQDLAKALGRAALTEGVPEPQAAPQDVNAYYAAGEQAGITRKGLEDALHRTSVERLGGPALEAMRGPLTHELQPIKPSGGKLAMVAAGVVVGVVLVAVGLWSGSGPDADAPAGPPSASGVADGSAPAPVKQGKMDQTALMAAWQQVVAKAQGCHNKARKKNPKLGGRLVFDVEWAEDGAFARLEVKEDTVKDAPMLACVTQHMRAAPWPKPQGGVFAAEFPLTFQVTERARKPRKK